MPGDGAGGRQGQAGHGLHKTAQEIRRAVDRAEEVAPVFRLILRPTGAQCLGEPAPERVESGVEHIEIVANILRLAAHQKGVGLRRIGIRLARTRQHAEGDESIEEVPGGTRMEVEACGQGVAVQGARGEYCEEVQFHGTEKGFRAPKGDSKIDDGCRTQGWTASPSPYRPLRQGASSKSWCRRQHNGS